MLFYPLMAALEGPGSHSPRIAGKKHLPDRSGMFGRMVPPAPIPSAGTPYRREHVKIPPCSSPSTPSGATLWSLLLVLGLLQGCSEGTPGDASTGTGSTAAAPTPAGEASRQSRDAIPPIRVIPSVLNWGTTDPETTVDGSVELENISKEPLTIVTVQSSCACTGLNGSGGGRLCARDHAGAVRTACCECYVGGDQTVSPPAA